MDTSKVGGRWQEKIDIFFDILCWVLRISRPCVRLVPTLSLVIFSPPMKTNAVRLLESLGVRYRLANYEVDPDDLSAPKVAGQIGMPPQQVFKTLLVKGDVTGFLFAVLPGDCELDLKTLARISANRGAELVPLSQLQPLTGYIRGGVTALAAKKTFPVYLDQSALQYPAIAVSAGIRGTQILLAPADYQKAAKAIIGPISRK